MLLTKRNVSINFKMCTGLKANFHIDLGSSIISMVSSEKVPNNFVEKLKISIQNRFLHSDTHWVNSM